MAISALQQQPRDGLSDLAVCIYGLYNVTWMWCEGEWGNKLSISRTQTIKLWKCNRHSLIWHTRVRNLRLWTHNLINSALDRQSSSKRAIISIILLLKECVPTFTSDLRLLLSSTCNKVSMPAAANTLTLEWTPGMHSISQADDNRVRLPEGAHFLGAGG